MPTRVLVGRDGELAALLDAVDHGAGAIVTGAAGIGKSSLASEAAAAAGVERVEWIRATAATSQIPLAVFARFVPAGAEVSLDRFRQALIGLGGASGSSVRTLLVLDDANHLDDVSASVVQQALAAGARALITVRDLASLPEALGDLVQQGVLRVVPLGPLARDEVAALVAARVGGDVETGTVARIATSTGGNPLFVSEAVSAALESGNLRLEGGLWRLIGSVAPGDRLTSLLELRFRGLPPPLPEVLQAVAEGEPAVELALVARDPDSERAVRDLVGRGWVVNERHGARSTLRIAHPLHTEVLRTFTTDVERRLRLARLADRLEATGLRRHGDRVRLARLRLDAGQTIPSTLAVAAARRAAAGGDFRSSERFARAGLAVAPSAAGAAALAVALHGQDRHVEANDVLAAAEPLCVDDRERAEVCDLRVHALFARLGRTQEAVDTLWNALGRVTSPAAVGYLRGVEVSMATHRGEVAVALRILDDLARRPGLDAWAQLRLVPGAAVALALAGRFDELTALAEASLPVALTHADELPRAPGWAISARLLALLGTANLDEADALAETLYEATLERGSDAARGELAAFRARVALDRGAVATAQRWALEATVLLRDQDHDGMLSWAWASLARSRAATGDGDGAAAAAEQARRHQRSIRSYFVDVELADAAARFVLGDVVEAASMAQRAGDGATRLGQHVAALTAWFDAGRFAGWDPVRERIGTSPLHDPWAEAMKLHAAGGAEGRVDDLARAEAIFAGMGARLYAAESAVAAAAIASGAEGAAAAERARRHLDDCEGAQPAGGVPLLRPPLTSRERAVVELAASGLSNREIGSRLDVGTRTVESHLQRAYRKLGVAGRHELGALLARP